MAHRCSTPSYRASFTNVSVNSKELLSSIP